jgi:transcriptional regulator NrdR family protein
MICPNCKQRAVVKDSRERGDHKRRRYACECGTKFTTAEIVTSVGNDHVGIGRNGTSKLGRFMGEVVREELESLRKKLRRDRVNRGRVFGARLDGPV